MLINHNLKIVKNNTKPKIETVNLAQSNVRIQNYTAFHLK